MSNLRVAVPNRFWYFTSHRRNFCLVGPKMLQPTENLHQLASTGESIGFECIERVQNLFKSAKSSKEAIVRKSDKDVLLVMGRDQRVQDNWAMLYAQSIAQKNGSQMYVTYTLDDDIMMNSSQRHHYFILKGLVEVCSSLESLNIPFIYSKGSTLTCIKDIVNSFPIGHIVLDFSPLRQFRKINESLIHYLESLTSREIIADLVDAHNIVPVWISSNKREVGARTLRPKIVAKLQTYLTDFPLVIKSQRELQSANFWSKSQNQIKEHISVLEESSYIGTFTPGAKYGLECLSEFLENKIKAYKEKRNDPNLNASSNLSPWLHFGQISAQRIAFEVLRQYGNDKTISQHAKLWKESAVNSFLEELIVRRELADNFCYHCPNYDQINFAAADWAKETLNSHSEDKRAHVYSLDELEKSLTHDDLWNAAQKQMVDEGKMHGFLRMYWAKKILEWSDTPQLALTTANYLNDKYSLDGSDPSGYTGTAWSICGVHDQGWAEREIFGKIRYMNFQGCKRKFDVAAFISNYSSNSNLQPKLSKFVPK